MTPRGPIWTQSMNLRKFLLRIMIWSLAAAAVLGALAILTSGSDIIWRIAGTTGATAACAAALMAASLLLNKETGRASGLVGMAAALIATLLSFLLIWELVDLIPTKHSELTVAATIGFIFLCVIPAMAFLRLRHHPAGRIASNVGVILTALTFAMFLIPVWELDALLGLGSHDNWYGTAAATGCLGLLAVACLISIDQPKPLRIGLMTLIRIAGIVASALAWCLCVRGIWTHTEQGLAHFTTLVSAGCVAALTNLSLLATLTPGQRWVRVGTIVAGVITAICVDILAFKSAGPDEFLVRVGGAAGFVTACGSLALIILTRMNRPMAGANREYREAREIAVVCPGCRSKQTLPVGASTCPTCHLRFNIRIDEPRCAQCDYLLFMLTGDKCPECGASIAPAPSEVPASAGIAAQ